MSVKKDWISAAITLMICTCGLCTCGRAARISRRNMSFDNQSKQTVDLSALTLDTTFSDAIDILRNSTEPPLKIVVLWRDLRENAGVEQDTPIYIDGVSGVPLRTGLKILLRSVSSGLAELDYVVDKGIIIVGTKDSLPAKKVVRIYDISYLVGRPATFGLNFGAGFIGGWPMRANWGGIGPGTVSGRSGEWGTYGRRIGRGTGRVRWTPDGGTMTIWGQTVRVREQNEIAQLIKHTVEPDSWR